jgi:hypothetical protein
MTKVDYGNPAACRDCPLRRALNILGMEKMMVAVAD